MVRSSDVLEVAMQSVTIASIVAMLLPPASNYKEFPRFYKYYNAFVETVDWFALNKRLMPRSTDLRLSDNAIEKQMETELNDDRK